MDINFRPRPILAGYEIGSVIGIGTYGEVRVGKQLSTGQRVAVKIVDLSRFEQETAAIMVKEIDILRSIDHPHVVRIIDVIDKVSYTGKFCSACACTEYSPMLGTGECMNCAPHDGHDHSFEETRQVMLLVQDLAVGGELFGLLMHTGPFPEEIARYYFQQLISGLEFLHNRGVIHRDLKPENLVLDGQFQLKIVDFGLAAHVADNSQAVLHSGVGSAPYSAPEVFYAKELYQSRGYNGRAADLWSCAVILFVMLTGRPPFVRPLARTYAPHLKRCKHFINILRGQGYGNIGTAAKTFLSKLFQLDARDRLTIEQIKHDEWFQGPVPSFDVLCGAMEEKANAVWMAVQKPQMLELLAKQRADLLHTPVFAPLRAPVAPTLLHSLSAEDRARLPQDPFQHANVDVSLLSLEERAASPVYRSLPMQMFQAEGDLEFDYLAHKRSGLDSHAHCGADEWLADADCNLGPCCGKDKSYLQSGWSLSEHLGEDENEESDHERDCEEAEDSDYHPSPNQYRFTGQPLENKSAGGEVFETHPHCHASSPSLDSLPQFPEAPALAQWLNPPVNLVSESAPDGLLLTRAPPLCWPATESVAQYSRMIFQQPAADVLAQFTHRLNVLGISHRSLPGDSLYLNGAFSGSPLTAVISVRACAHQPAFVGVEFNRIRGDPITFHQFARFVARLA